MITTINFHLLKACNYRCKFCYATFNDIKEKGLNLKEQFELIRKLAEENLFNKINFAGGEPTLLPHIKELIIYAKELGFETSIVTNASKIDFDWLMSVQKHLDILTISIDSVNNETNLESGRNDFGKITLANNLLEIANACHMFGISLKINTVVSKYNYLEILSHFINKLKPFRWKILQATKVKGQNDSQYENIKTNPQQFSEYCKRNSELIIPGIKIIEENSVTIQGSYLMIDQMGRFFDSAKGKHNYSESILNVGVRKALNQVNTNSNKFLERHGNYSVLKQIPN